MNANRRLATILAFCCLVVVFAASCGPNTRFYDSGRKLVNAAGLSTNETLKLLQAGANVNARSASHFGWTPLISAVYHHNEDVVDLLLAFGANPNVGDNDNRTPLAWAVQCWAENTNVIYKLIEHGGDPSIKTKLGSSAFDLARSQPNETAILEILKISQANRLGTTNVSPKGKGVTQ